MKFSIFEKTLIAAFIIVIAVLFGSCQKDEVESVQNSDVPLNEGAIILVDGVELRDGIKNEIVYLPSKSSDNFTVPGVPRKQTIWNAFKIDTFFTKLISPTVYSIQHVNENGTTVFVQHQRYELIISYKDGSSDNIGEVFLKKGTPPIVIPTSESILNIGSLAKWTTITNIGQPAPFGNAPCGKQMLYYDHTVRTNLGPLPNAKIASTRCNTNTFTFKHKWE